MLQSQKRLPIEAFPCQSRYNTSNGEWTIQGRGPLYKEKLRHQRNHRIYKESKSYCICLWKTKDEFIYKNIREMTILSKRNKFTDTIA